MNTTSAPSGVSSNTVERAINALLKWRAAKSKTQKPQLLENEEFVYLIVTLKKIPQKGVHRINPYKISLPNALIDLQSENSELCLIIDDRPKSGLNKDDAKKKIQNDNIPISKIIKLSKLRTDYRPFEVKRKLCDSYDMFFADRRVIPLLPKMLGKQFFKKKKIPVAVDLKHKNWKEQIEKVCGSGLLFLSSGTCSVVKVAKISMSREDIVNNVTAAINGIADIVPRKWGGIRSLHLKLLESLALPVYEALPDFKMKIEGVRVEEKEEKTEKEVVEVEKVGKKKKGRIHEIKYMDNIVNDNDDDDIEMKGDDGKGDIDDDEEENEGEEGIPESEVKKREVKKRKKGDKGKIEKKTKAKKEDGVKEKKKVKKIENGDNVTPKKRKKDPLSLKKLKPKLK